MLSSDGPWRHRDDTHASFGCTRFVGRGMHLALETVWNVEYCKQMRAAQRFFVLQANSYKHFCKMKSIVEVDSKTKANLHFMHSKLHWLNWWNYTALSTCVHWCIQKICISTQSNGVFKRSQLLQRNLQVDCKTFLVNWWSLPSLTTFFFLKNRKKIASEDLPDRFRIAVAVK